MLSELTSGAYRVAQKLEPIAAGMPAIAFVMGVGTLAHFFSPNPKKVSRKTALAGAGIFFLSAASTFYNRKLGLTASAISCVAFQIYRELSCEHGKR